MLLHFGLTTFFFSPLFVTTQDSFLITNFASLDQNLLGNGQGCYGNQMSCSLNSKGSGIIMNMKSTTNTAFYTILGPSTCSSILTQYNYIRLAAIGFKAADATLDLELESSNRSACSTETYFVWKPVTVTKWISVAGIEYGETKLTDYIDPSLGSNPLTFNHAIGLLSFTKLDYNFTFLALSLERYSISSMTTASSALVSSSAMATTSLISTSSSSSDMANSLISTSSSSISSTAMSTLSSSILAKDQVSTTLPSESNRNSAMDSIIIVIIVAVAVTISLLILTYQLAKRRRKSQVPRPSQKLDYSTSMQHLELKNSMSNCALENPVNFRASQGSTIIGLNHSKQNLINAINESHHRNQNLINANNASHNSNQNLIHANNALYNSNQNLIHTNNALYNVSGPYIATSIQSEDTAATTTTGSNQVPIAIPGYLNLVWDSDFVILEAEKSIGKGGTANILVGTLSKPELITKYRVSQVAVKVIKNDQNMPEDTLMENFLFEIALISSLPPSPNIVGLIGYTTTPRLSMIMKLYKTTLSAITRNPDISISPSIALCIAFDIATGMALIHKSGILHLDLKPQNVLIEVSEDSSFRCAICDFGFASICGGSRPVAKGINVPKTVGITVRYTAPEVFTHLKSKSGEGRVTTEIDKKIDVYAYAITMYEILAKRSAWQDLSDLRIMHNVNSNQRPPLMEDSSITEKYAHMPSMLKVVTEGWKQKPEERPSFATILQWLQVDIDITKQI